jgi:hypothetical protein
MRSARQQGNSDAIPTKWVHWLHRHSMACYCWTIADSGDWPRATTPCGLRNVQPDRRCAETFECVETRASKMVIEINTDTSGLLSVEEFSRARSEATGPSDSRLTHFRRRSTWPYPDCRDRQQTSLRQAPDWGRERGDRSSLESP